MVGEKPAVSYNDPESHAPVGFLRHSFLWDGFLQTLSLQTLQPSLQTCQAYLRPVFVYSFFDNLQFNRTATRRPPQILPIAGQFHALLRRLRANSARMSLLWNGSVF